MALMTNRVKVWRHVQGLTTETNNFAFDVKVTLDLESTIPGACAGAGAGAGDFDNKTSTAPGLGLGLGWAWQ